MLIQQGADVQTLETPAAKAVALLRNKMRIPDKMQNLAQNVVEFQVTLYIDIKQASSQVLILYLPLLQSI